MYRPQMIPHGILTVTLSHIPYYGKVRIIYTDNIDHTWYGDGIREFNINDVMTIRHYMK